MNLRARAAVFPAEEATWAKVEGLDNFKDAHVATGYSSRRKQRQSSRSRLGPDCRIHNAIEMFGFHSADAQEPLEGFEMSMLVIFCFREITLVME